MRYKKKFVKRETQEKFYFWTMFVKKWWRCTTNQVLEFQLYQKYKLWPWFFNILKFFMGQ
jgi:hypothetical protein